MVDEQQEPENPYRYVPMERETEAKRYKIRSEKHQFQAGEHGIPRLFSTFGEVTGLVKRRSGLFTKENFGAPDTEFTVVTVDAGPVYVKSIAPERRGRRHTIDCWFFDMQARKVDKALRDQEEQLFSQPWILVRGTIEKVWEWIDKEDIRKGKVDTGAMCINATSFILPPVPKLSMVRDEFRDDDIDEGPIIRV